MLPARLAMASILLCTAAGVAYYTAFPPADEGDEMEAAARRAGPARPPPRRSTSALGAGRHSEPSRIEVLPALRVTAAADAPPAVEDLARAVETHARHRMRELARRLHLTRTQQTGIFPFLVRSAPGYRPDLQILGVNAVQPLDPLSRRSADKELLEFLDSEQRLEMEIEAARADAWWANVITRLEQDLVESTEPGAAVPAPALDEEPPAPKEDPPAPSRAPPAHHNGNLFDLLNRNES